MKIFLVYVPCYNEQDAIFPLALQFQQLREMLTPKDILLNVIWIDDCSSDNTFENITSLCKQNNKDNFVIHHPINKGLVGALETMLSHFRKNFKSEMEDILGVGLLDGDNSQNPIFFESMLLKISEGYDVVIASRFREGSAVHGVPQNRKLLSIAMSFLFRLLGRVPHVRDYSCGFRAYSPGILLKLGENFRFINRSFACMVELLMACHQRKASFAEVPLILRYDYKISESKMKVFITIKETLYILFSSKHKPSSEQTVAG